MTVLTRKPIKRTFKPTRKTLRKVGLPAVGIVESDRSAQAIEHGKKLAEQVRSGSCYHSPCNTLFSADGIRASSSFCVAACAAQMASAFACTRSRYATQQTKLERNLEFTPFAKSCIMFSTRVVYEEFDMTVLTRKPIKRIYKPIRKTLRKAGLPAVRIVEPDRSVQAIERGRKLAEQVRLELAALNDRSLDQVMSQMRGRRWSS